ncbi:hypothetical protein FACS189459_5840 [Bacilli bacterium]|nr:hypothetical protein FACS189459_5840 [Bacilli bacterium]
MVNEVGKFDPKLSELKPHLLQLNLVNEVNFNIFKLFMLVLTEQLNSVKELGKSDPKLAELILQLLQFKYSNEVNFDISKPLILVLEEQSK